MGSIKGNIDHCTISMYLNFESVVDFGILRYSCSTSTEKEEQEEGAHARQMSWFTLSSLGSRDEAQDLFTP